MITAVDTNILLDVFGADASFGQASANALRLCLAAGAVDACEIVWAETAAAFTEEAVFVDAMTTLGISFQAIDREAAISAGTVWRVTGLTRGIMVRGAYPTWLLIVKA